MKVNVSNMPMNKLYKFADRSYVWTTQLYETRNGNYKDTTPKEYTEVYRIDGSGLFTRVASGRLVDNPAINDYDHRFSIFDYDQDMMLSFFVEEPFKEANLDELYKLQKAIARSYESNQKNNGKNR